MLAGVGKGIANYFGIADWIPRALFVITAFMGGLGVALYLAGWAFIRSEDESESVADRFFSGASTSRSWLGIGLMVVAGIIVLSNFTWLSAEVVWAAAFLVVGLLLYTGHIPVSSQDRTETSPEPQEGVQQMTTSSETAQTETLESDSGDSPAGGFTPPPAPPTPTPPDLPPAKPREKSILGRLTIGFMLLGMGVLAIVDNVDALPIDARPQHYLALAVTILGVGLLVGSLAGRARWLILVGVLLIPPLLFSPVFNYERTTAEFHGRNAPVTFEQVEPIYDIDVGGMAIDLRSLPWEGEEVTIDASVDIGNLEIYIPEGVGVIGTSSVDIGRVSGPGRTSAGLGNRSLNWDEPGELGTVVLDAHVSIGNISINP